MKREVPLFITAVIGLFMMLSFFIPHQIVSVPANFLQQSAVIVVAFGYVLGGTNVLRHNIESVYRRESGWGYKVVLIVALLAMLITGIVEGWGGRDFQGEHTRFTWMYNNIYSPMSSTMFALLAFFIASAAFRAFRIRTVDAALLAIAALIVMLGRVPIGAWVTAFLPEHHRLPDLAEWIMNVPQNAAKRAILIGAALGLMSTGLRVILGIERSYLSGED